MLNTCIQSFKTFFYIPHDNSVQMMQSYLSGLFLVYGKIDQYGNLYVYGSRLLYMSLLAFVSFIEIVKEFFFIGQLISYDSSIRYIFIDCSILFPSIRYYYIVIHAALSLPFCLIFFYFWMLNVRYYYVTRHENRFRSFSNCQFKSAVNKSSFRWWFNQSSTNYTRNGSSFARRFNFRFLRFLMMGSIRRVSKQYEIELKYVKFAFNLLNVGQSNFYPM